MAIDADEATQDTSAALSSGTEDHLAAMRHSAAHMLAAAVLDIFPDAKLGIGPAIKDGFYYDFDLPRPLTPADLEQIEAKMREQQAADLRFERSRDLPRAEAIDLVRERNQPFKVEIIEDLPESEGPTVSFYRHGDFEDLCRGGHLGSTKELGSFKLLNTAGAYWRGDETRPMLQRIYGTAWETQEELDQHLWRVEEAKKRDHRKIGRELDLFTFHPESPAAPFLHPRGMALWRSLEDWSRQVRREAGFHEVRTPSLVRKELWETSGHWNNYQDNMFVLDDHDHVSGLKPMNCPEEILVYKTRAHSYRELPIRFADYSVLFRKERTGVLAGMFRVRQLTQDDSHVFCRDDQVDDEIRLALALVRKQYAPFGFEPRAKLATRPEKRLGSDEFWEQRREPAPRAARGGRDGRTRSIPAVARSTRRRSTSSSRTPSAASGRWRRSRPTTSSRSASTSSTARPMAASSARSSSTTRSTGPSSASSASSPSTTAAPSRSGWPRCR